MKTLKIIMILLFAEIFISGCKEKPKAVEIVPNLESIYLPSQSADIPVKEEDKKMIDKDIIEAIKSLRKEGLKGTIPIIGKEKGWKPTILYIVSLRLFINKNGTIDKIKDLPTFGATMLDTGETLYTDAETLDKELALKMVNWKYKPAKEFGHAIKSWVDLFVKVKMKPDDSYNIESSNYASNLPNQFSRDTLYKMPTRDEAFIRLDIEPKPITKIKPKYPEQAKLNGISGTVYVRILIDTTGKPITATIIKSDNEIFNKPSIDAAMKFRFSPAERDNRHFSVYVVIPFKYKL